MIFRQLFDASSSTYTYLLGDGGEALLIDPVYEQAPRDLALLQELGLRLVATLDTHVHADHVIGAWLLKQQCGSAIMLSRAQTWLCPTRPPDAFSPIGVAQRRSESMAVRRVSAARSTC